MTIEERLRQAGIELPEVKLPVANYVPYVQHDGLLHISGQVGFRPDGSLVQGRLGETMSIEEGQAEARLCALHLVSRMKQALGSLDRVTRIVKLGVFVSSAPGFTDQPKVGNGASDLMVEVFGDAGRHARSAVGVAVLPFGVGVEVDAIVAYAD